MTLRPWIGPWAISTPRQRPWLRLRGGAISADEARDCFGCHSTGAISGLQLRVDRLIPGVTCEACHGPGADHIASMVARNFKDKRIFNPGHMGADEMSQEFCGSCHRSAEQAMTNKSLTGIVSVRFQPYRIFTSRGHHPDDMRLRCTSCHNPHSNPVEDPAFTIRNVLPVIAQAGASNRRI